MRFISFWSGPIPTVFSHNYILLANLYHSELSLCPNLNCLRGTFSSLNENHGTEFDNRLVGKFNELYKMGLFEQIAQDEAVE